MGKTQQDVIVVGAGLAGLAAARTLTAAGVRVGVVEARERVGGRTWSKALDGSMFDLGGQWIGPDQPRMLKLVDELGLRTFPTHHKGTKVLSLGGKLSTYRGDIPRISPAKLLRLQLAIWGLEHKVRGISADTPWTHSRAVEYDGQTVGSWLRRRVKDPDTIGLINVAARVIFGADCDELSMLHFLHYASSSNGLMKLVETDGGNQELRVDGGTQQISQRLAEGLEQLTLGQPVTSVSHGRSGVDVHTTMACHHASRVIMAVPLPLLDRIDFQPGLPTLRAQLIQRSCMGATVKCHVLYERPFWRENGYSGEIVDTGGPISVVYDNCTPDGRAALVVFLTGAPARGWSERPEPARRHLILSALARVFGEEALQPVLLEEVDWATERFSGGAPIVNFPPGTLTTFGTSLRAPVGRIHWAGTETARTSTGFMEGAVASGERAAAEVLRALGGSPSGSGPDQGQVA